jgi:pyruvate dehydrogenase E2 component (dihydrolipoamide acetyltransferase)
MVNNARRADAGRVKQFNLPDLGEGLTEGEILRWLVAVGDLITQNQPIVEVETAKAAVEIPAKWAGRVASIFCAEGSTIEVGTPIIAIDTDPTAGPLPSASGPAGAESAGAESAAGESGDSGSGGEVPPAEGGTEPGMTGGMAPGGRTAVLVGYGPRTTAAKRRPRASTAPAVAPAPPSPPPVARPAATPAPVAAARPAATNGGTGVLAKPPVRKLAKDLGVDLVGLVGSGPQGSITREDVQAATVLPEPAPTRVAAPAFDPNRERRVPVKGIRKLTAENMVASAFTAPHVTEFLTVDVTRSIRALERIKGLAEWRDVRVSPLLLVAKAVLLGIQRYPMVNSSWQGDEIVVKEYVNLGIAAATERGLIVPNIADAGTLTLRELADAMSALVQTAKAGKTTPANMTGGTFTITNVGVFGVDTGTPILPPGEAAILVFGAIREMPWVTGGNQSKKKVKIRSVTTLGLSFDHRIVDGELGSKFLRDVGAFLADPEATLLAWS